MNNKKQILYVQTSGLNTPERLYAPFILATTAKAMGYDAIIYFVIRGVEVIRKGAAEKVKLGEFPSLREVMDQAIKAGVQFQACEQSCALLGIPRGEFIPEVKIVGAATLNKLSLEADATHFY
ncbi:MAG: DsrE/DsrF/DrsH-like family protein [Candidatus Odinarchaeia archaeon]